MPHFFYSDPHFGHANIIKYCNRPFRSTEHMTQELIRRYNERVKPDETVLWCGDSFFKGSPDHFRSIMSRLNGTKILVKGNHDKSPAVMAELGFDMVLTECVLHLGGRTCRVSHFPYADIEHQNAAVEAKRKDKYASLRPKRRKGEVLIHGHTHDSKKRQGNAIHVGVDAWDYAPVSRAEVEELIALV